MPRITNAEKTLLAKYDFNTLEFTTVKQMYEELALLQKWSMSGDENLKKIPTCFLKSEQKNLNLLWQQAMQIFPTKFIKATLL